MAERLAVFFGLPAVILFIIAEIVQIAWILWVAVGLFTIAGAFFAFDQMDGG
jgi:hypothetical protein